MDLTADELRAEVKRLALELSRAHHQRDLFAAEAARLRERVAELEAESRVWREMAHDRGLEIDRLCHEMGDMLEIDESDAPPDAGAQEGE